MYTQCSSCATLFSVTPRHLRHARGRVRCCLCQEVFDALPSLTDILPVAVAAEHDEPAPEPAAAPARPSAVADLFVELPRSQPAPVVEDDEPPRRRYVGTIGWTTAALVLLAVLCVQYAYVMREELARYPRLRPWIETLCLAAHCELPLLRDAQRVHILHRDVGLHPTEPGALLVRATLVNDTGFRQPYPQIRFSFLDPNGEARASRWFAPDEYLARRAPRSEVSAGMTPQEPVAVRLQLPGIAAVALDNFEIQVR